jgi:hypothetical protein
MHNHLELLSTRHNHLELLDTRYNHLELLDTRYNHLELLDTRYNHLELLDTRYNHLELLDTKYNHLTSQLICLNADCSCLRSAFSFCRSNKREKSARAGLNSGDVFMEPDSPFVTTLSTVYRYSTSRS